MKRDFDQVLLDLDGKAFGDGATLKMTSLMALRAQTGDHIRTLEACLK